MKLVILLRQLKLTKLRIWKGLVQIRKMCAWRDGRQYMVSHQICLNDCQLSNSWIKFACYSI